MPSPSRIRGCYLLECGELGRARNASAARIGILCTLMRTLAPVEQNQPYDAYPAA